MSIEEKKIIQKTISGEQIISDGTVKEKYGFLPTSVKTFKNVPPKWKKIDGLLDINLERRGADCKYLPSLKYSKFSYELSEFVIKYWSEVNDTVLDPFMGWGIRGAVSICLKRNYIGFEISPSMHKNTSEFISKVKDANTGEYRAILGNGCLLNNISDSSIDFIFTCPPYWNIEKYESAKGQLSDCQTYEEFLKCIDEALSNCYRVLKPDKFCVWVVGDFRKGGFKIFHKDVIDIAIKNGFIPWDIVISVLNSPFAWCQVGKCEKSRYTSKMHEYILVFKKEAL